eukprot:450965-Amphidinium_carterae.1
MVTAIAQFNLGGYRERSALKTLRQRSNCSVDHQNNLLQAASSTMPVELAAIASNLVSCVSTTWVRKLNCQEQASSPRQRQTGGDQCFRSNPIREYPVKLHTRVQTQKEHKE